MNAVLPGPRLSRRYALTGAATAVLLVRGARAAAATGPRVALVIGNESYRHVPRLANPTNDARLIARTLAGLGFTLVGGGAQLDLDKAGFEQAIAAFGRQIRGAEVALFYYSGHGMQVGGVNWLVPVSADPSRLSDLPVQMVSADEVLRQAEGAGTRLNIVILDACRNDPFALPDGAAPAPRLRAARAPGAQPGPATRGMAGGGGLAVMQAPPGTLISYATQPGNVALDGAGGDSPFSAALAQAMRQPGISLFHMFNEVGLLVERATKGRQQPWVSNSPIPGYFRLAAPNAGAASAASGAHPFDGIYEGTAPGGGFYGCPPVTLTLTVDKGSVSGTARILKRGAPSAGEAPTVTVTGQVASDGTSVLRLHRAGGPPLGAPLPGRFVAGRFEGTMGGQVAACSRRVVLRGH